MTTESERPTKSFGGLYGEWHGPGKLDFIERRLWLDRFELIPRKRDDNRLFAQLTEDQGEAYNLIEEAHGYAEAGPPLARQKFTDAPGGYDWELTPKQMDALTDYYNWNIIMREFPVSHWCVCAYMAGATIKGMAKCLRVRNTEPISQISSGLSEYCAMKKWSERPERKIRISGYSNENVGAFGANYFDEMGRPVRNFKLEA